MRFEYGELASFCEVDKTGFEKAELRTLVESAGGRMGNWARDCFVRPDFRTSNLCERVEFVMLTPRDFGYDRYSDRPTMQDWLDPKRLASWSREHLHHQLIELCDPDDAFYLRAHYNKQPEGEVLPVAMEPVVIHEGVESSGNPWKASGVFYVDHVLGERMLYARYAMPGSTADLYEKWIFRLSTKRALRKS